MKLEFPSSNADSRTALVWAVLRNIPALGWGTLAIIVVCSGLVFHFENRVHLIQKQTAEEEVVTLIQRHFTERLNPSVADLHLLADEPTLRPYLDHPDEARRKALEERLLWWAAHEEDYFKIRILDTTGKEMIRVNHRDGRSFLTPREELLDQSTRDFVNKILALNKGDVFVSPMGVNTEKGHTEIPPHPTMRVGMSLFDSQNRRAAILVLNYDAKVILDDVAHFFDSSEGSLQLLDARGAWLRAEDADDDPQCRFDVETRRTFRQSYPAAWQQISAGEFNTFETPDGMYVFRTIRPVSEAVMDPLAGGGTVVGVPTWKIVSFLPRSSLRNAALRTLLWILSLDVVILFPLAAYSIAVALHRVRLHATESQLRQQSTLIDLAVDDIYTIDARDDLILFWNSGAERRYGFSREEAIGRNASDLMGTEFPISLADLKAELYATGSWEGEIVRYSRSGRRELSLSRWAVQRDAQGKPLTILIINHDITDRKRSEEQLRKAHRETEFVLDAMPSLLVGLDGKGAIARWNHMAEVIFGLPAAAVLGRRLMDCGLQFREPSELDRLLAPEEAGQLHRMHILRGAETRVVSIMCTPVSGSNDNAMALLIVGFDVTERVVLETQLRQAQKLEGIGQLAAGIAHEINTPIQYVGDNIQFIQESWQRIAELLLLCKILRDQAAAGVDLPKILADFDEGCQSADIDYLLEEIPAAMDQSLDGVQRVARIVRAMKEFSHPGSNEKKATDINHSLQTAITVARNEWKYAAEVVTEYCADLPAVQCLQGEMNQVFLNLLINAAHAIGQSERASGIHTRGQITVSTRKSGDYAEIRISDTGCGIPPEIRSRVFEPFFTTKEVGKGTGQGLSLAHSVVVKQHGGQLWFESEVGKGTTFFLRIPFQPNPSGEAHA